MRTKAERLHRANALLHPCAIPLSGTLGREHKEAEDDTRFPFQRDLGRIIHTQAFRRLKGKTQVFVTGQGDHYRTRLTHTMEVAQVSRDIARTLELNEDLAECIALAHDLGHPPFGHTGEEGIAEWMQQFDQSFEHNHQSYRIVTVLEHHCNDYAGLNLNREVLEGLLKHRTPHDHPEDRIPRAPSLEAQLVNIADEIAYTAHDTDDGLREELFSAADITTVPLGKAAYDMSTPRGTSLRGAIIQLLVTDLYAHSTQQLRAVDTLDAVYSHAEPLINFSAEMQEQLGQLRACLWERMYLHDQVRTRSLEGKAMLQELLQRLYDKPTDKVREWQEREQCTLEEAVKDYVAGMTDWYAAEQAREQGI